MNSQADFKPRGDLTFDTVISTLSAFNTLLNASHCKTLCLDLSTVGHCDSAGLALIIEAKKMCKSQGKSFILSGISEEIQSLAEFYGVKALLF